MKKNYKCPDCGSELEELYSCGAESYFCYQCKANKSRKKIKGHPHYIELNEDKKDEKKED